MQQGYNWGACAALICAGTYVFGFALLLTVLAGSGYGTGAVDPMQAVAFLVQNSVLMQVWNLAIYVLNGLALAALAVVLAEALANHSAPSISARMVFGFGLLWAVLVVGAGMVANVGLGVVVAEYAQDPARAALIWQVLYTVESGLGGGNEIAGGVWALWISAAAWRSPLFSRGFAWVSALIGVSGLATLIPALSDTAGAIFGLGYIGWFLWVGVVLWRAARRG